MHPSPPTVPPALDAGWRSLAGPCGTLGYYHATPTSPRSDVPVLLVHSVNAAASAYEMGPLFHALRDQRPVFALDLPGFGTSERPDVAYSPTMMSGAIEAMAAEIERVTGHAVLHGVALSLSCEFLARAACASPQRWRSVALISPTAFNGETPRRGPAGETLGRPAMLSILRFPAWARAAFRLLTTRSSIRFFLRKTFGCDAVPPGLIDHAYLTSHQAGARHAPYRFISGFLFSRDAFSLYESLTQPVWMVHGDRGDFQDYRLAPRLSGHDRWRIRSLDSGALPHFEDADGVASDLAAFLDMYDDDRPDPST